MRAARTPPLPPPMTMKSYRDSVKSSPGRAMAAEA
jgi:hypothetical protein